ncbi:MAG: hypothetical protein V1712_00730 [Patescibacteria group bacterium]
MVRYLYTKLKGVSLIEVMLTVFIALLLLLITYSIFNLSQHTKRSIEDRVELVQNQRAIVDRLFRELRQANAIVTSLPSNEILFEDGHGNLDNLPIQYLRYYLDGANLYREARYYSFAASPDTHVFYDEVDEFGSLPNVTIVENRLIGEYIAWLQFIGDGTITIGLTFTKNNQTITLTSNVAPRNLK